MKNKRCNMIKESIITISDEINVAKCNIKNSKATIKSTVIEQHLDINDRINTCLDDDERLAIDLMSGGKFHYCRVGN